MCVSNHNKWSADTEQVFTSKTALQSLDSAHHYSALRFRPHASYSTHRCVLCDLLSWPSLYVQSHVYKAITGQLPSNISVFWSTSKIRYYLCSSRYILFERSLGKISVWQGSF